MLIIARVDDSKSHALPNVKLQVDPSHSILLTFCTSVLSSLLFVVGAFDDTSSTAPRDLTAQVLTSITPSIRVSKLTLLPHRETANYHSHNHRRFRHLQPQGRRALIASIHCPELVQHRNREERIMARFQSQHSQSRAPGRLGRRERRLGVRSLE